MEMEEANRRQQLWRAALQPLGSGVVGVHPGPGALLVLSNFHFQVQNIPFPDAAWVGLCSLQ